ncbi:MAG: hypothetical protein AMXMBFR47_39110 [Planctomycetota bacterium]
MNSSKWIIGAVTIIGLSLSATLRLSEPAASLARPAALPLVSAEGFTLARYVPNDVFVYVAEQHNPERQFLEEYWNEVFAALDKSGIGQDALELIGSVLSPKSAARAERLKERANQLLAGVDWRQLAGREFAFAERLPAPASLSGARPPIFMPDMVWLFRGSGQGVAQNFAGLVAILEAIAEEINQATGSEAIAVARFERSGARVASLNLLALVPGAPELPLSVALREDVIIVALRGGLFEDVLGLMAGTGTKPALATEPRFTAAFAQLPPAEDSMTFFDLQAFLNPLLGVLRSLVEIAAAPGDIYLNTAASPQGSKLNAQALAAYQRGDIKQALALTEKFQSVEPKNAIALYNLACFNSLAGNKDAALDWLEKAVDGGFYAPTKIASDVDLDSLRDEARYRAALARAIEQAKLYAVQDTIINFAETGEASTLTRQAQQAYHAKDYEQALKLAEQAYAVAPKDSHVLYNLACFHALLGHRDKALEFLGVAVECGYFAPRQISKDADLAAVRDDPRYQAALTLARNKAAQQTSEKVGDWTASVRLTVDKLADTAGIIDVIASVETTDGHATWTETLVILVPDAQRRPIYPVIAGNKPLTEFDRFLPQETASFSVSSGIDPRALYQFLENSVREIGPPGEALLARWADLQEQIGVDVQQDVVGWMEGSFISVDLADARGSAWLLKVTDEQIAREKVGAAIEFVVAKLPEVVGNNPSLAPLAVISSLRTEPLEHEQLPGFQSVQFAMMSQPAVWGVAEGHLVLASSADAAALCLETARGKHPGIRKNARLMAETVIPSGPFTNVSLTDQRRLGEELAEGMGIASMITGVMGSFVPDPHARTVLTKIAGMFMKLAPVLRKIDFYKSTASYTTFDGQKWRTRQVTHYLSPTDGKSINDDQPVGDTGTP